MEEIIKLNSVQQNEFLVWSCLEKQQIEKVCMLLDNKMQLTTFMLTTMVMLDYDKQSIKKVLCHAQDIHKYVFIWLKNYFKVEELIEVFKNTHFPLPSDYPTNEECVALGLWDILIKRGEFDLVAQNRSKTPEEMFDELPIENLLKIDLEKYGPRALQDERYTEIMSVENGWKYLFEHGKKEKVFSFLEKDIFKSMLPIKEIVSYCKEKGWIDDMYNAGLYDTLLVGGEVSSFVKAHSINVVFVHRYPKEVPWEELWNENKNNNYVRYFLISSAKQHTDVPECVDFLKKHSGVSRFWHNLF